MLGAGFSLLFGCDTSPGVPMLPTLCGWVTVFLSTDPSSPLGCSFGELTKLPHSLCALSPNSGFIPITHLPLVVLLQSRSLMMASPEELPQLSLSVPEQLSCHQQQ